MGEGLRKILANISWLLFERIFRLIVGLVVSILVIRHLGPKNYGILSYAVSIITFLGTFASVGLSGLVVREIKYRPEEKDDLLGTVFTLKFVGVFFAFLLILGLAIFSKDAVESEFYVLLIIGLSLFARPFETIGFWFQSKIQSKYVVYAKSSAFILAAIVKVLLVVLGASVVSIATTFSLELFLAAILLVFMYRYKGFSVFKWTVNIAKARDLLSQSWILILSGFLGLVYLKIDQIMLRWMVGPNEVGFYSVAVIFSETWYFFPAAIATSVFPRLLELKETNQTLYEKRLQQIFDVLFVLAFSVAVLTTLVAYPLVGFLYGDTFLKTSPILVIHIWAGIFMFMRALFSKWILIENALHFSLISHGFGALVNVLLNLILIPRFEGRGAALATLFSYAASSYFILFIHSKTRPLAKKMSKSLIFPLRFAIQRGKVWA